MKIFYNSPVVLVIVFCVGFVLGTLFHKSAQAADAGACYTIQDSDARAVCLARANHRPDLCYNVQRADLRSQCLAEVRK